MLNFSPIHVLEGANSAPHGAPPVLSGLIEAAHRPWYDALIHAAALVGGEQVLDAGCRSGGLTRRMLSSPAPRRWGGRRGGPPARVTGLDNDARALAQASATTPKGDWRRVDPAEFSGSPNTYHCALAAFYLDRAANPEGALNALRLALVPSGRIALAVRSATGVHRRHILDLVARHADSAVAREFSTRFFLGAPALLRRLVNAAGYMEIAVRRETRNLRFASVSDLVNVELAITGFDDRIEADEVTAITADAENRLGKYCDTEGCVVVPTDALILTARRV